MIDALLVKAETVIREKSLTAYKRVRRQYSAAIEDAILDYFIGSDAVTAYRNAMSRAMSDAFLSAFELAYIDGGAELPLDDDALEWLASRQEQELGYIRELFVSLKELKAQYRAGDVKTADIKAEMVRRRDGYLATLDGVYNAGLMYAQKNVVVEWELGDTEEHCETKSGTIGCLNLANGPAHRISWYLSRDLIPRKNGAAMTCGGWRCDCRLRNKKTGEYITL